MTDPASPATVTEERWPPKMMSPEMLESFLKSIEENAPISEFGLRQHIAAMQAALDARGLDLARSDEEVARLKGDLDAVVNAAYDESRNADLNNADHLARALAAEARLAQANEALAKHAVIRHVRMAPGGCEVPSGFSCDLCDAETDDPVLANFKHNDGCILSPTPPAQSAGEALDPAGSASRASGAGGEKISKAEARLIRHIDNVIASHEPAETECDCAAAKDGLWADVHSPGCAIYGGEVDGGEPDEAMLERGRDVALGLTRVAEENYARGFADGQAAQASALAEARRSALEEAAKIVEGQSTAANYMPLNEPLKMIDWVTRRDFRVAGLIRALTEPQHGNG